MSLNKFTDNTPKPWLKIHAAEIICPQGIKKSEQQTHTFVAPTSQDAVNDGHVLTYNHTTKETEWKAVTGTQGPIGPTGPTGPAGPAGPAGTGSERTVIKEVTSGTVASIAGGVSTRNLNTVSNAVSWQSFNLAQGLGTFRLSTGTYHIKGISTVYTVGHSQLFIYNVTKFSYEDTNQLIGYGVDPQNVTYMHCDVFVTVNDPSGFEDFQLRHWTENASELGLSANKQNGNMSGNPSGGTTAPVSLSQVTITKLS